MYQAYENAVGKVNKYLIENHFSVSVMYSHLNCYRLFKQYLEENRLPYSHGEAIKWLNSNRPGWKHSKFKTARLSLFRLNDLMRNGCITTDSYVYENSCNYDRLPEWCRSLLDGYLNDISNLFSEGYVKEHRMACSEFLIYVSSVGGKNERDIIHKTVIGYYNQSEHRTIQAKNSYNRKIRYFLKYLADKNLISASLTYALDRFNIPRIMIIDELTDAHKKACIHCSARTSVEIPASEYLS